MEYSCVWLYWWWKILVYIDIKYVGWWVVKVIDGFVKVLDIKMGLEF